MQKGFSLGSQDLWLRAPTITGPINTKNMTKPVVQAAFGSLSEAWCSGASLLETLTNCDRKLIVREGIAIRTVFAMLSFFGNIIRSQISLFWKQSLQC